MTDEDKILTARIQALIEGTPGLSQRTMFGGICFMINGNMCTGPWKGSLIVRLDRIQHNETQAEPNVHPMDLTGKVMRGWAIVDRKALIDDDDLKGWLDRAVNFASGLPPK